MQASDQTQKAEDMGLKWKFSLISKQLNSNYSTKSEIMEISIFTMLQKVSKCEVKAAWCENCMAKPYSIWTSDP